MNNFVTPLPMMDFWSLEINAREYRALQSSDTLD